MDQVGNRFWGLIGTLVMIAVVLAIFSPETANQFVSMVVRGFITVGQAIIHAVQNATR